MSNLGKRYPLVLDKKRVYAYGSSDKVFSESSTGVSMKPMFFLNRANYNTEIPLLRQSARAGLASMVGGILDVQTHTGQFFAAEIMGVLVDSVDDCPGAYEEHASTWLMDYEVDDTARSEASSVTPRITFLLYGGYSVVIPARETTVLLNYPQR